MRIEPVGQACAASIGNFTYTARASGLAPGNYILRVRHEYPGTGWDATVQEHQVTVH